MKKTPIAIAIVAWILVVVIAVAFLVTRTGGQTGLLDSHSGSIRVSIDESLSFKFEGQSASGGIKANIPLQKTNDGHRTTANIGTNSVASIKATASSGSITINLAK